MWKLRNKCRDEKRNTREFLYWFTHQELRPVHLTPRWNPLKHMQTITVIQQFLKPTRTSTHRAERHYFSTPCTPRNTINEWLTLTPITRKNKGKITPEIVLQEHKPVVLFASRQHQHLHPAQGSSRTSTHVFSYWKTFANSFSILFLT